MKKISLAVALFVLPVLASAEELSNIKKLVIAIGDIIELLIPIVFALALLYFFWGLGRYILGTGQGKEDGKSIMVWGIVGLFLMASVWGIVKFIGDALGVGTNTTVTTPSVKIDK